MSFERRGSGVRVAAGFAAAGAAVLLSSTIAAGGDGFDDPGFSLTVECVDGAAVWELVVEASTDEMTNQGVLIEGVSDRYFDVAYPPGSANTVVYTGFEPVDDGSLGLGSQIPGARAVASDGLATAQVLGAVTSGPPTNVPIPDCSGGVFTTAAPRPPPTGDLPATGNTAVGVVVAAVALAAGTALVALARRGRTMS